MGSGDHKHVDYVPVFEYGLRVRGPIAALGSGITFKSLVAEDTDSDTNDVLLTGLTDGYGLLVVSETTAGITAIFRVDYHTPTIISADAAFTIAKDTASKFNVYWETDQFKVQNKAGNNRHITVGFFGV